MIKICDQEKHTDNEAIIQVWLRAILFKNITLSKKGSSDSYRKKQTKRPFTNRKAEHAHISKHLFLVDVDLKLKFLVYFNRL